MLNAQKPLDASGFAKRKNRSSRMNATLSAPKPQPQSREIVDLHAIPKILPKPEPADPIRVFALALTREAFGKSRDPDPQISYYVMVADLQSRLAATPVRDGARLQRLHRDRQRRAIARTKHELAQWRREQRGPTPPLQTRNVVQFPQRAVRARRVPRTDNDGSDSDSGGAEPAPTYGGGWEAMSA